jgi:hypothetical protein
VFRFTKWYYDLLTPGGLAAMAYAAELSWRPAQLGYGQIFIQDAQGRTFSRSRLQKGQVIEETERGVLAWRSRPIGVSFTHERVDGGSSHELLSTSDGFVRWEVLHARSRALLELSDAPEHLVEHLATHLGGAGYVERVTMTIPPWRLPLKQLRWGHFVGERSSMVWLAWDGPHTTSRYLLNGEVTEGAMPSADEVHAGGTKLRLGARRVLREGTLGQVALRELRGALEFVPLGFLAAHEQKWVVACEATLADGTKDAGWAIDERVDFP